jgi:hypothetical protein
MRQINRTDVFSSESNTEIVTLTANTANVRTKIAEFKVQRGQVVRVDNLTSTIKGVKKGVALIFDPRKADGNPISRSSRLYISVEGPGAEFEKFVRRVPIAPWLQLSLESQSDENFKARLCEALDLNVDEIVLREGTMIQFQLVSPDVINWGNSYLELPISIENI